MKIIHFSEKMTLITRQHKDGYAWDESVREVRNSLSHEYLRGWIPVEGDLEETLKKEFVFNGVSPNVHINTTKKPCLYEVTVSGLPATGQKNDPRESIYRFYVTDPAAVDWYPQYFAQKGGAA